eukprot:GHVT01067575.1.p1 GENE.GHVT01067575.1~~GHVT01067575.1.p1  ORF type:complete len:173 (+),score=32.27 GHVT01067575.1:267-785(+)
MSSSPNRNFLTTPPPPIASPVFPSAPASSISVAAPLPGVPPVAATSLSGPFPTSPGPRGLKADEVAAGREYLFLKFFLNLCQTNDVLIVLKDGRRLYCRLLFLDSHLNLVIADCEESFLPANCVSNSAEERRRKLEIANLRWEHVQSIHAHPDLIADVEMQIKNTLSEHHKA